jgi:transcriptional regulator with XRE-family HTH domain
MKTTSRKKELSSFLKARRAALNPQNCGFPPSYNQRRTPGLRREEVAQLAGISTTWYTWFEQGREVSVSLDVLNCISDALQLSIGERQHLQNLTFQQLHSYQQVGSQRVEPTLLHLIQNLPYPALIANSRTEILGWNEIANRVFVDFSSLPEQERSVVWLLFANTTLQSRIKNWEEYTRFLIGYFRKYYDQNPDDPIGQEIVSRLHQHYPQFKEWWDLHEIREKIAVSLIIDHPTMGQLDFELRSFVQVSAKDDIHHNVCIPMPDTDTEIKLFELTHSDLKKRR